MDSQPGEEKTGGLSHRLDLVNDITYSFQNNQNHQEIISILYMYSFVQD